MAFLREGGGTGAPEAAIFSLEEFPTRCPVTPEDNTLRHCLYGDKPHTYRIIYEIDEPSSLVRVLFIRHGARQPLSSGGRP